MPEKTIHRIDELNSLPLEAAAEMLMHKSADELISTANWSDFPYIPETKFWMGFTSKEIFIHFTVLEQGPIARFTRVNDPVCRDSCVEFFISPGDNTYFNFEFNAAGTPYAGRGLDRSSSIPLSPGQVKTIRRHAVPGTFSQNASVAEIPWSLTVGIPLDLFKGTRLEDPAGLTFSANFYKCAEETDSPHFVTWSPVMTDSPDFHRPEYFGTITFV